MAPRVQTNLTIGVCQCIVGPMGLWLSYHLRTDKNRAIELTGVPMLVGITWYKPVYREGVYSNK